MAANRILLVEDDHAIADAVALNLRTVGYEVVTFDDGAIAAASLEQDHSFDLALLDIMLPGMDGFQLFALMEKYNIPVIYMTAKTDSESEVRGLKEGAEDYIVKPFEIVTLLVRIEKVLSRTGRLNQVYRFQDFTLDAENRTLTRAGEPIDLPPLEFDVFAVLMKNKNRTVSRERILNEIWGEDYFGDIRTVDVRVANLRKKLGLRCGEPAEKAGAQRRDPHDLENRLPAGGATEMKLWKKVSLLCSLVLVLIVGACTVLLITQARDEILHLTYQNAEQKQQALVRSFNNMLQYYHEEQDSEAATRSLMKYCFTQYADSEAVLMLSGETLYSS